MRTAFLAFLLWLVGTLGAFAECRVHPDLRQVLNTIEASYGHVKVTSVCGGKHARHSFHYRGQAVDFRVSGSGSAAARFVRSLDQGNHVYTNGIFHIDLGPRRPWS